VLLWIERFVGILAEKAQETAKIETRQELPIPDG
jgi:hypothetical protein